MKFKPVLLHFKFDNFADLPSDRDDETESDVQTDCNGHKWFLALYPGGQTINKEPGRVGLYLHSQNDASLHTKYIVSIKDSYGVTVKEFKQERNFLHEEDWGWGENQFIERSKILNTANNILRDGALYTDVAIQVKDGKDDLFQPPNDHCKNMLNLLTSQEKADTSFNVGQQVFLVHSLIINANAPLLANHSNGDTIDTSPEVFQLILEHIYAGRLPEDRDILKHGKELINVADRYELIQLKMTVESVLVRERVMTIKNVADYILFADAKSCALLKEYAICFFSTHCRAVLESKRSKPLKESAKLLSEIMMFMNPRNEHDKILTVNELRTELGKLELDVDGSKDTLVSRLEEAKRQRSD